MARGRPPIRASGAYTPTEHQARWRANAPKKKRKAEQRARRIEVNGELGILPLAISGITDTDLASESVDAVLTDPPYAEADIFRYGELAHFASRVLKPSGWCVTLVGDLYLDRIIDWMRTADLVHRSVVSIFYPGGQHSRFAATKSFQAARFALVLQKPPTCQPPNRGPNVIVVPANGHDKSLHEWQQSQHAFEKLVEHFTAEGSLVVDPFAGSGTTLRAAITLRRRAWGADIDAH